MNDYAIKCICKALEINNLVEEYEEYLARYEAAKKWEEYYKAAQKAGITSLQEDNAYSVNDLTIQGLVNELSYLDNKIKQAKKEYPQEGTHSF